MARPDAILFNGGFCIPAITRERIADAIANWFGARGEWRPKILSNHNMSSAVAIGAAYYGRVRRGAGLRVQGRQCPDLLHRNALRTGHQGSLRAAVWNE